MSRAMSGVAVVALIVGALLGFLGSLSWSSSRRAALDEARNKSTRLERQVVDLRTENDRLAAQLKDEHTRVQTIAGDLRREKEINMRLHMLVSDGRK
jgi:predicted negative regulator of RcsB-dependent stress response